VNASASQGFVFHVYFENMEKIYTALEKADYHIIGGVKRFYMPFGRIALFVVFFWFGILKLFYLSPANPLVADLLARTLPFMTFNTFIFYFGIYEMIIGITFLIPGLERLAIALLIPHMITTFMPLLLLPAVTWQAPFVPTLEGQYIIKNLLIIALAMSLAASLQPFAFKRKIAETQ